MYRSTSYLEGIACWEAKNPLRRNSTNEYRFSIRRRNLYCCIATFPRQSRRRNEDHVLLTGLIETLYQGIPFDYYVFGEDKLIG